MISDDQKVLGGPHVPMGFLKLWLIKYAPAVRGYEDSVAAAYTVYGELTRFGNLLPFSQGAKETGWFSSERWVKSYNPAGLGATNDGSWGGDFRNPAEGIAAQYAHLAAYAIPPEEFVKSPVNRAWAIIDPRYHAIVSMGWLGTAPRWRDLDGKWAFPGIGYGKSIIERANKLLAGLPERSASWLEA